MGMHNFEQDYHRGESGRVDGLRDLLSALFSTLSTSSESSSNLWASSSSVMEETGQKHWFGTTFPSPTTLNLLLLFCRTTMMGFWTEIESYQGPGSSTQGRREYKCLSRKPSRHLESCTGVSTACTKHLCLERKRRCI